MASALDAEHATHTAPDQETRGEAARDGTAHALPPHASFRMFGRQAPILESGRRLIVRLALSFAVLILTMLALSWWIGRRIMSADSHLEKNLTSRTAKLHMVYDALGYSRENSRITMNLLLAGQIAPELQARKDANHQRITDIIAALDLQSDSEQERRLVASVRLRRAAYLSDYQRALRRSPEEKRSNPAMVLSEATPALFAYHGAWEQLAGFELQQMEAAAQSATEHDATTRRIGLALQWLAAVLAAMIALFSTRRIAKEVTVRARMQYEVHMLNARLENRVAQRTEELARRDEQLQESLVETQEYAADIEAVNELAQLLQSCMTLEEAEQQASRVLSRFFSGGAVLLLNSSRNLLEVALAWGGASSRRGPFSPESCWALRKGQVHLVGPHCPNPVCGHYEDTVMGCHMCMPMIAQGASLGVLNVDDSNLCEGEPKSARFERKRKLAGTLAKQMSLTFANLRLREALKYQSVRDPLTRLFNRRHMEEALERELCRAARKATPVAVLMMDIDHFKRFNDTYGHEAGDVVLQEFGSLLQREIRGGDIACRYGGEEFLLIMIETGLEPARKRAEALRKQVSATPIRYRGQLLHRLTISIGVAIFPIHANSGAQIITVADGALYRAKHEGRDRVAVAE